VLVQADQVVVVLGIVQLVLVQELLGMVALGVLVG
jgi:hypothetical protein